MVAGLFHVLHWAANIQVSACSGHHHYQEYIRDISHVCTLATTQWISLIMHLYICCSREQLIICNKYIYCLRLTVELYLPKYTVYESYGISCPPLSAANVDNHYCTIVVMCRRTVSAGLATDTLEYATSLSCTCSL